LGCGLALRTPLTERICLSHPPLSGGAASRFWVPLEMALKKETLFMSYLKSVTIVGFVGADPEQRQARNNNGSKFTVLSVAP
jgi:hypothetical protein